MNKNILSGMIFGAVLLLLAACTQDDPLGDNGTTLPEGVYPLEISSVTLDAEVSSQPWGADAPQTRVSENPDRNSSKWDGGETIYVQLDNTDEIGEFKINKIDENITVTPVNTVYWTKRKDNVTAWYPANGEIRLDNQQDGNLAYVLRATAENAAYGKPVTLDFSHQLAKIRVKLAGEKAGSVTDVKIESYTSCTNTNGVVEGDETSVGEITMYKTTLSSNEDCWEANVVPGKGITKFRVNGGDWVVLSNPVTPEKGKIHEISIDVKKASLKPGTDGKFTVNGGDVLIKDYKGSAPIVVNGTATITLDNVKLTTESTAMEINNGATVTLKVKGTNNSLTSTNGSGIGAHENCNIIIQGESIDNSKLTVSSGEGRNVGIGFIMGQGQGTLSYGNIEISDVTLSVTASSGGSDNEGAAIGVTASVNGGWQSQAVVENITITNSNVTASSKRGAACIGTSFWENDMQSLTMGVISIENSTVTATNQEVGSWLPACIGMGTVYAGSVTIQKIEIESSTLHLTTNASNKVGKGTVYGTATITEGIIVNGDNKGNDGWNPS